MATKTVTHLQQQLINTLLYKPEYIRTIISQFGNPMYAYHFMRNLLPHRVGLEIDIQGFSPELYQKLKDMTLLFELEGPRDMPLTRSAEVKFSFKSLNQLKNFKEALVLMDKFPESVLPMRRKQGGIHIHVDIGPEDSDHLTRGRALMELVKLDKVITKSIFRVQRPGNDPYLARRNHNTIEYRLGIPTFNYSTIIRWMIGVSLVTNAIRLQKPLNKSLLYAVMRS